MSLDIFCKLYEPWKKAGKIIYENDHAYAILSVTPATPGHAIVISKSHVETLDELRGESLEGFVDAIPATLSAIQDLYQTNPAALVEFYQNLRDNPPVPVSAKKAKKMLRHKHLLASPDWSHNVGYNVGEYAGQMVNHLHAQLFPRRERGPGIVTAMEDFFSPEIKAQAKKLLHTIAQYFR
ncbi:HIT family protein [Candidatus Woesearchaeota archaeon]|jgi:diadenosine tetraphosphate (Ap4A) HIT family hydrolase|nr:HIT family protein [Candidatus Woesearchaeota archaeon]